MDYDVWVDFTDADANGRVRALQKHVRHPIATGDVVIASDGEDAYAKATVGNITPTGWVELHIHAEGAMPRSLGVEALAR